MEKVLSCDTVIIGAGSAGIEAYKAATEAGANCILVESGPLGSTSQRTGETPLSSLGYAGLLANSRRELEQFGIKPTIDYSLETDNILNNIRAIRCKDIDSIVAFIYRLPERNRVLGKASFVDPFTIKTSDNITIKFKTAVIATGTVPLIPFELNQYTKFGCVYTITDLFELDHLPNSVAIFGASGDGLQIGQALSYLGIKTTVFGDHHLWELTDEAVIDVAIDLFRERFDLAIDSYTTAFEYSPTGGFCIFFMDQSQYENFLNVDSLLAASTKFAKVEGLNLREIGINLTRQGSIAVNTRTMQTSLDHIFAAGGAIDLNITTTQAKRTGVIAGRNAANFPKSEKLKDDVYLNILYTDPEMAIVGLTYDQVKQRAKQGLPFMTSDVRSNSGRFRTTHHSGGILRLYCDEATRVILGAEMCMYRASHIAHYLSLAIRQRLTVDDICEQQFFDLGYEEIILKACNIAKKALNRKLYNRHFD